MYALTCGGLSQVTRPQPLRNLNSCMPLLVSSNLTSPPFLCQSTYNPFIGFVHGMYAVKIYIDSSISHQQAQSCGTGCHRNTRGAKREVGDFIMVPALSDPEQVSGKIILRIIGVNLKGRLMYGHSSEESRCKLME